MTNRSLCWNEKNKGRKPFLLNPAGKSYLWGGNRLNDDFSKGIDMAPLAETWECSTHPEGMSIVGSGIFRGKTLAELLKLHPEFLGTNVRTDGELPFLVKFIDAREDLSVQVHPNDAFARKYEKGQSGKTEMWYVLDAREDTQIVYGLYHDISREELRSGLEDGTLEKYLQKILVKKNDVFYIEAGTIHAIGAGALIVEVQQNSNLTYRLYDYDRVDKNGQKRELHVEKALQAARLKAGKVPAQPLRVLKYTIGSASELICRCPYFEVHRILINTERCRQMAEYQADSTSFRVLLCLDGCGSIYMDEEVALHFFRGDCIFVPARSVKMKIHGKAQFLDIR